MELGAFKTGHFITFVVSKMRWTVVGSRKTETCLLSMFFETAVADPLRKKLVAEAQSAFGSMNALRKKSRITNQKKSKRGCSLAAQRAPVVPSLPGRHPLSHPPLCSGQTLRVHHLRAAALRPRSATARFYRERIIKTRNSQPTR